MLIFSKNDCPEYGHGCCARILALQFFQLKRNWMNRGECENVCYPTVNVNSSLHYKGEEWAISFTRPLLLFYQEI